MRNVLLHSKNKKKEQEDPESIFYYESYLDPSEKKYSSPFERISPLFIFLFILPVIFVYLLKTIPSNGIYFKTGVVLFLEISTWFMDLWISRSLRNKNIVWVWLAEIPFVLLVFFSLYLTF
jgi:hypothetical protein